jgi:hypothetical protein
VVVGVILCNISGTNIGATILLTKVVRAAALPYDANRAAAIALAVASNIGAVSFHVFSFARGPALASHFGAKEDPREAKRFRFLESFTTLGDDNCGAWDCFCRNGGSNELVMHGRIPIWQWQAKN